MSISPSIHSKNTGEGVLRSLVKWLFLLACAPVLMHCTMREPPPEDFEDPHLDSLLRKGIHESETLEIEESFHTLNQVIAQAEKTGNDKYLILGNLNMGALYMYLNAYDEALTYFFKSLEKAEETEHEEYLNSIYNNLGIIYSKNNAHEKAEEYFQQALDISRERNESRRVGLNLINLGITTGKMGDDSKAIGYFQEAAEIFREFPDSSYLGVTYNSIGDIYRNRDEYDAALGMYRSAHKLSSTVNHPWRRWEYSLNMARTYTELQKPDSARKYLTEAREGFASMEDLEMMAEVYDVKSRLEQSVGNHETALADLNKVLLYKDSLLESKSITWVSELQLNYEFGKKEQEVAMMKRMAERTKTLWIGSAVAGFAIVALLFIVMRGNLKNLHQKNIILEQKHLVDKMTIEKNHAQRENLKREMENKARINALNEEKLRQEIDFRNRELTAKALYIANKNEMLASIGDRLSDWSKKTDEEREEAVRQITNALKSAGSEDSVWESFQKHFEEVHPDFFANLSAKYPSLNSGDLRIFAYFALNLSNKEIARLLNVTPEAVRKRKQRLREKIGIDTDVDLTEWVRRLNA